jgi:BlaI family penicillinase repressor
MKKLSEAQLEIMLVIWDENKGMTRSEISQRLTEKSWKAVTLNTFLNRLTSSGFLKCEQRGKEYVYTPLIEKNAYLEVEGKSLLNRLYHNSLKNFIASVYSAGDMTDQELTELQSFLQQLKGDDSGNG